jgi:hypothetical protein
MFLQMKTTSSNRLVAFWGNDMAVDSAESVSVSESLLLQTGVSLVNDDLGLGFSNRQFIPTLPEDEPQSAELILYTFSLKMYPFSCTPFLP